jgi:hypothetical protein
MASDPDGYTIATTSDTPMVVNPWLYDASAGVGNFSHLAMELFAQATGVKLLHVPYKGFKALHITPLRSIWLPQTIEHT